MVAKLTLDNAVTLIRYCSDGNSLAKPFDLSQRLKDVSPKTQIGTVSVTANISWRGTNRSPNLIQRIFLNKEDLEWK